jgi:hypothetical protein
VASRKASAVETDFHRGDYGAVLRATVDAARPKWKAPDLTYIIGALTFVGRLEEAELHFSRADANLPEDVRCAARFFLGIAHCRQSNYQKSLNYFLANLRASRSSQNHRLRMFTYQGLGFFRYFCGRYPGALRAARKALSAALEANFLYGKFLAADLIGHALIQTGQVSSGMKQLQDALFYSKQLGNGDMDDAVRISLAIYNAQFGNSPASDLETLQKLYDSLSPQDTYSQSSLLLEMGRQYALRGKLTASQNVLNQACRLIYSSGHRRQSVMLNLRYAFNLMLSGENHQALNLLRAAAKGFDPRVDKALELQVLGFEAHLKCLLGLGSEDDPLRTRLKQLTQYTGMGISRRMIHRKISPGEFIVPRGEDPVGDLYDQAQRRNFDVLPEILSSGFLSLLYPLLQISPGESLLYFDLLPSSLLILHKGNLDFQAQGISSSMKTLVRALAQGECSKEELIQTVWGYKYDPLRHDSLIYPAISRLRQLLGERGNWIEVTNRGYRLNGKVQIRFFQAVDDFEVVSEPGLHEVPAESSVLQQLNFRQISILKRMKQGEVLEVQKYKEIFQVSQITATRDLSTLHDLDLLKRVGKGRATRYVIHFDGTKEL